ncbi:DedA family protein [bacterium]|nr:DedA family protein [bacterium]MBU1613975.1 DedA family protein [bacterium]
MVRNLISWILTWASTPYGPWALFFLSFAESSFFFIPPDFLLIALALPNPSAAITLAAITTLGSVLGGMLGYFIGLKGERSILEKFVSHEKIRTVHNYFQRYEAWAIFISGFTPIPYQVFTIGAGLFYIDFKKFVLFSILGRGTRFFTIGLLIFFFGEEAKHFISKYFNLFSILFVVLLVLGFYLLRRLHFSKKEEQKGSCRSK